VAAECGVAASSVVELEPGPYVYRPKSIVDYSVHGSLQVPTRMGPMVTPQNLRFWTARAARPLFDLAAECYPDEHRNLNSTRSKNFHAGQYMASDHATYPPASTTMESSGRRTEPMAEHTEGPRVIRCKGSWLEMGRQYGEELRADIAHASRAIEELAIAAGHDRMSLKARINDYIPYAQKLPARWDELVGVAQGSCLAIEDVLLMQMLEDLLDVDACTTAGRDGLLLHAEMWFASHTDYAVLISEPTGGPPVITVSCIGFLTGVGLNGSGFAMGVQSTSSRDARVGVPRAMVSRSALCALSAAEAVREATRHHRSGGNGFVIVTPTGVQVVETSAAIDDVTEERPWGAHTNHYISDKFQTVANSAGESVQRLEEAVATLGGVSDRELMERARFLVQSPGFVPRSPDRSVVTAFVMLADIELGAVQTAPGGGGRGPWVRVTLP